MKLKSLCFSLVLLLGYGAAYTQESQSRLPENTYAFTSENEAREMIQRITGAVGLKPNFEIRAGNVDNAAALAYRGTRYIIYNPVFIRQVSRAVNTDWAGISILAHEIGHHLNGHTLTAAGSSPELELEADEFSGHVLRKLGASLAEAQAAMQILAGTHDSRTHPAKSKRLSSIEKGWKQAGSQLATVTKPATRPEPEINARQNKSAGIYSFPSMHIAGQVHFYDRPDEKFYITVQSNFIYVDNEGYRVLGKLVKNGNAYYLSLGNNNFLPVSEGGRILDRFNKPIGYVSRA